MAEFPAGETGCPDGGLRPRGEGGEDAGECPGGACSRRLET